MAPGDRLWAELGAEASGTQEGIGPRVRLCGREVLRGGLLAARTWSSRPSHPTAGWAPDHRSARPWMVGWAWTLVCHLEVGVTVTCAHGNDGPSQSLRPPHGREAEERPSCPLGAQRPPSLLFLPLPLVTPQLLSFFFLIILIFCLFCYVESHRHFFSPHPRLC